MFLQELLSAQVCSASQVWWTLTSGHKSTLYIHDLRTASTVQLPDVGSDAAILSMDVDGAGRVWLGHKHGLVQVFQACLQGFPLQAITAASC